MNVFLAIVGAVTLTLIGVAMFIWTAYAIGDWLECRQLKFWYYRGLGYGWTECINSRHAGHLLRDGEKVRYATRNEIKAERSLLSVAPVTDTQELNL